MARRSLAPSRLEGQEQTFSRSPQLSMFRRGAEEDLDIRNVCIRNIADRGTQISPIILSLAFCLLQTKVPGRGNWNLLSDASIVFLFLPPHISLPSTLGRSDTGPLLGYLSNGSPAEDPDMA